MFDGAVTVLAIVDDLEENRLAAEKAVNEMYPEIEVRLYASATEFISALAKDRSFDFVLSDMCMETKRSGYEVAVESWSWRIPCTIVSGGSDHGQNRVYVGYPKAVYNGEKSDPELWKQVIQTIQSGGEYGNAHRVALRIGKSDQPDKEFGQTSATVALPLNV